MIWLFAREPYMPPGYLVGYHGCYIPADMADTIIGGANYLKVYSYPDNLYRGAYRNENDLRGFLIPKGRQREYRVYDFTVSAGEVLDSIATFDCYSCSSAEDSINIRPFEVQSVVQGEVCHTYLKCNSCIMPGSTILYDWSSDYSLYSSSPLNYSQTLGIEYRYPICVSINDTIVSICNSPSTCWNGMSVPSVGQPGNCIQLALLSGIEEAEQSPPFKYEGGKLKIYQNLNQICVIDLIGNRLVELENVVPGLELSLDSLGSGI